MSDIERMRKIIQDEDPQFNIFSDDDLQFYIDENDGDVNAAIYQCLLIRADDTSINLPGLSASDTSKYFKRLATKYRPNNTGVL